MGLKWGPEGSTPKPLLAKDFKPLHSAGGKPTGWLRRAFRSGPLPACCQVAPFWFSPRLSRVRDELVGATGPGWARRRPGRG